MDWFAALEAGGLHATCGHSLSVGERILGGLPHHSALSACHACRLQGLQWQPQYADALETYFNATLGTLTTAQACCPQLSACFPAL